MWRLRGAGGAVRGEREKERETGGGLGQTGKPTVACRQLTEKDARVSDTKGSATG